jgi:hypothetical protein
MGDVSSGMASTIVQIFIQVRDNSLTWVLKLMIIDTGAFSSPTVHIGSQLWYETHFFPFSLSEDIPFLLVL